MNGVTFDTGGLIALDRNSARRCVEALERLNCGSTDAENEVADDICDEVTAFSRIAEVGESCSFAKCAQGSDYQAHCEYAGAEMAVCVGYRSVALGAPCDADVSPKLGEARVMRDSKKRPKSCRGRRVFIRNDALPLRAEAQHVEQGRPQLLDRSSLPKDAGQINVHFGETRSFERGSAVESLFESVVG